MRAPAYPTTATIAGIAWIVFGGLIFLCNLLVFLQLLLIVAARGQGGQREPAAAGGVCVGFLGLGGAVFIDVGVQGGRGMARDTLGNGIGSILFGLLDIGFGLLNLASGALASQAEAGLLIYAGTGLLAVPGLVAAGVLALGGRSHYEAWRQAQKTQVGVGPGRCT